MPDIRKIVQISEVVDVWDFVRVIEPDIILIHAASLTQELARLIPQINCSCRSPLLVIVDNEDDRQTAETQGADTVVMEGTPAKRLVVHITSLLNQRLHT